MAELDLDAQTQRLRAQLANGVDLAPIGALANMPADLLAYSGQPFVSARRSPEFLTTFVAERGATLTTLPVPVAALAGLLDERDRYRAALERIERGDLATPADQTSAAPRTVLARYQPTDEAVIAAAALAGEIAAGATS